LAFALLWTGTGWSVLGLFLAMPPMTFFTGSVINPNGLEIAASLAFAAGVLRLSRESAPVPWWVWVAVGVSGAVAVLAWQLGWLFVTADVLLLAALAGRHRLRALWARQPRPIIWAATLLTSSLVVYLIYGLSSGLMHGRFGVQPFWPSLNDGLVQLHSALYGAVGVFGPLTVGLPAGTYWVWWGLVLLVSIGGLVMTGTRERIVIVLTALMAVAFPVLFFAWVFRNSGFGLQARYVLPMLILIPLLGGELLSRSLADRPPARVEWLPHAGIAVAGGFQVFAWFINARDWAGEPNSVWFPAGARWSPPLGWLPWTIMALGSFALLLVFAATGPRGPSRRRHRSRFLGASRKQLGDGLMARAQSRPPPSRTLTGRD
jgi:hypothetical protein